MHSHHKTRAMTMIIRNRNYGAAVAKSPSDVPSSAEDYEIDPLDPARNSRSHSNNNRRKIGTTTGTILAFSYHQAKTAGFKWTLLFNLVVVIVLALLLVVVHESFYYLALNILVRRLPGPPYFGWPSSSSSSSRTTTDTAKKAGSTMAIVSLHKKGGYKFAGYLGTWLDDNKAQYAARHGYRYFNQDNFRTVMFPNDLSPTWQPSSDYNDDPLVKQFEKLGFLLSIFQRYNDTELRYALWLDEDAVIANLSISLEDRVTELEHQWLQRQVSGKINTNDNQMLFAWSSDGPRPDTGVMLLRNCAATRALLAAALQDTVRHTKQRATPDEVILADRESVVRTVQANATYRDGQLLLTENIARRLQSRVSGGGLGASKSSSSLLYQPGDWILHLPHHHSRLDVLISFVRWL